MNAANPFELLPTERMKDASGVRKHPSKAETRSQTPDDLITRARKLDEGFARVLVHQFRGGLEAVHNDLDAIESMSYGKVVDTAKASETGINQIAQVTYESPDGYKVEAFVKNDAGEATYGIQDGVPCRFTGFTKDGVLTEEVTPLNRAIKHEDNIANYVERSLYHMDHFINGIGHDYGLPPDEVPFRQDRLGFRRGIDVGQSTRSEVTTSRIDRLCGLGVTPITVIRKAEYGYESIQQKANARTVNMEDLQTTMKYEKNHPAAQSLIRIACLDYLVSAGDRHSGNLMFDEEAQKFIAIDNGMNLGLSKTGQVRYMDRKTKQVKQIEYGNIPMDGLISIPIEVVELRADWELDTESWQTTKDLYEELYLYSRLQAGKLSIDEEVGLSQSAHAGIASKYLSELFRFQYSHEAIASKELGFFLDRLRYLVENRKPPPIRDREDFMILTNIAEASIV